MMKKYAQHKFKGKMEIPIDSIAFTDGDHRYDICDRCNPNEDPNLTLSFILYPREQRIQLRLAGSGIFHTEKLRNDASGWREKCWLTLSLKSVDKLMEFLTFWNPERLAFYLEASRIKGEDSL